MNQGKTIVIGAVLLTAGWAGWKTLKPRSLLMGMAPVHPPAEVAVNFGPYPYPQDVDLGQHDPSAMVKKAQEQSQGKAVRALRSQVLEEAGQDPERALDVLYERRKDPEGSQALFDAMREMASGGKAPMAEGKAREPLAPLYKVEATRGVAAVARMAQKLAEAKATNTHSRFDTILLEDAIRLMGHYGGASMPSTAPGVAVAQVQSGEIDPVTRVVLRQFLGAKDGAIQALASRALGQLGDLETAKDLIKNPKQYPSASISDFGPEAVRLFQEAQTKKMNGGNYSDADMWQSLRLRPKDQEVAEVLAGMGDPGAGMAAARNWVIETMSGSVDQKLYQRLDILLRFPNTPRAKGALGIVTMGAMDCDWDTAIYRPFLKKHGEGPDARLTSVALLALLDRDFAVLFSGKPFKADRDVAVFEGLSAPLALMPEKFLNTPVLGVEPESQTQVKVFLDGVRQLYRQHFKLNVHGWLGLYSEHMYGGPPTQEDKEEDVRAWKRGAISPEDQLLVSVCSFAHRLGLPKPDWPRKKYIMEGLRLRQPSEGAWR